MTELLRFRLRTAWLAAVIRDARTSDFDAIIAIELAVGEAFREIGMAAIADDPPPSPMRLAEFMRSGVGWVETGDSDHAVAYLLLEQIDERAHIEQVTVHPDVARRGIGAA
jgi:ribosomal protein S18 acetylase RimI-like enzyme